MEIRKCNETDIMNIINIGSKAYFDTYHKVNTKENMKQYLDKAFDYKRIESEVTNPQSSFYFLYNEDTIVAYIKINFPPAQTDINEINTLEIERIYVVEGYKGLGYGKLIINKAIEVAIENKVDYIWLGVWEKNNSAIGFYKKSGFELFNTHIFKLGDDLQKDFLFKKNIKKNRIKKVKKL